MDDAAASTGSSFYWPLRLVPVAEREAFATVYAWCKRVDDLADGPEHGAETLFAWRTWLSGHGGHRLAADDAFLAFRLERVIAEYRIDRAWLDALLDGMTMDLAGEMRAPTTEALLGYCQRVAGMPGRMCLAILGWRGPSVNAFADAAGIAVQLTNILRDVEEDGCRGRLYIPREALDSAAIDAADPAIVLRDARFGKAWLSIALLAEARFVHADTLLPSDMRRTVRPALAMLNIYRALLRELRRRGWRSHAPRLVLPRWRRIWIALSTLVFKA